MEISKVFNLSPFEVMKQDKDSVIMMINYYIEKGDNETEETRQRDTIQHNTRGGRVRVNDKTATGGWF